MTDRIQAFTVTLADDLRIEDAEQVANAISALRHVVDVRPLVADHHSLVARNRAAMRFERLLWDAIDEGKRPQNVGPE